jgi:hypothetical protein
MHKNDMVAVEVKRGLETTSDQFGIMRCFEKKCGMFCLG